jgi:hypothetical protein
VRRVRPAAPDQRGRAAQNGREEALCEPHAGVGSKLSVHGLVTEAARPRGRSAIKPVGRHRVGRWFAAVGLVGGLGAR